MQVRLLPKMEREPFIHLTYPVHRPYVLAFAEHEVITVGGDIAGHPVGFAFAIPQQGFYEIGSLHVTLPDTNGALRRALLDAVIEEAQARGWGFGVYHAQFDYTDKSVTGLMRDAGWVGPVMSSVSARSTVDKMLSVWFAPRFGALRRGYEVVRWPDITAGQRRRLEQASDALPAEMKSDVCPLLYEQRSVPELSFLLLRDGEPIGWHLPEPFDAGTFRWTCSTVVPGHWSMAAVLPLWDVALRAQRDIGVQGLIWAVPIAHRNWVKFMFRRLLPMMDSVTIGAAFQSRIAAA